MSKKRCILEDWDFAKLHGKDVMVGRVFGHPRIGDGERVFTSEVVDITEDLEFVISLNTIFELKGPPKPGNANEMALEKGIPGLVSV